MHFKRRFDAFQCTRTGVLYAKLGSSASEDLLSPATNPRDELCRAHADALMQDSVASHARQLEGAPQALSWAYLLPNDPSHPHSPMATDLKLDRSSHITAPPSYHAISNTSGRFKIQTPWMLRTPNEKRAIVLSFIRDLVATADFTPSSVVPIVTSCATALSPAGFSDPLQSLNIEGHTTSY